MGFNCLKARVTSRRQFTFPRNLWYSFYRPQKDERLSRPWIHPVILKMGPLDWELIVIPLDSPGLGIDSHFAGFGQVKTDPTLSFSLTLGRSQLFY